MLFGTPAYCESQFCGPEVTELQRIAAAHPDRALYIHVEIWKNFNAQPQVVNEGAADWLLRTLPDGIAGHDRAVALPDRRGRDHPRSMGVAFDPADVEAALEALPPMDA